MSGFLDLLKRYIPPYKGWVISNVVFNLLGAIFGAFSFAALSPALGILFRTQELVLEKKSFTFSIESIKNHLYFYLSTVIERAGEFKALFYVGLFLIVMVFFKVGFTYLASFSMVPIRNGVVHDIRKNMFRKITQLPVGYFNNERKGDIISRITGDVQEVEASVMNSLEMLFKNPVLIIISLVVMFYMSWSLTIFVLIMMPVALLIIGRIGRSLKKTSGQGQAKMGEILSTIEESISGLTVIKAFNAEKTIQNRFGVQIKAYFQIMNRLMWRRFLAHPVSEFLGTTIMVVVLWYGGRLILSDGGGLKAQDFITYLIFFYSIINPSKALSTAYYSVQKGLASMERIDELLNAPNPLRDADNAVTIDGFANSIEFKNVSFSYDEKIILKNINLTIKKGEKVALVGQSGSGKTTLVNLIPRFWDVQSGDILIDGMSLKDIKIKDLRALIGYVNQDPILFNGTFVDNIAIAGGVIGMDAIEKASNVANAHEFILKSENGFNTNVGDRGSKLSGGQRQRISIARAVLKNPPILILDEATSSLDTESEKYVQDALEKLMDKRTSLVVAHRLSTILNADKIVVMQDGEIVEQGTHDELLNQKGVYEKLFNMQFG